MLLFIAAFSFSCTEQKNEFTNITSGQTVIFSDGESGFSLYDGSLSETLRLINTQYGTISVTLHSDNGKSCTLSAEKGASPKAHAIGGRLAAAEISLDGFDAAYALSAEGLTALLESDAENIILIGSIIADGDLTITRPLRLNAADKLTVEGSIYYITKEKGELVLEGDIVAAGFACSAPLSDIVIPEELADINPELFINALSVNGEAAVTDTRTVTDEKELSELISLPPYFDAKNETIVLSGLTLEEAITIPFPCSLRFENSDPNGLLTVETEREGEITIWGDILYAHININAPDCHIKWDSPCTLTQAQRHFNALTLNGYKLESYKTGGEGSARILSAEMSSDGKLLTEDIKWIVSGYNLITTVSGVAAPSDLRSAQLTFETEGGEKVRIDRASRGDNGGIDLLEPLGTYVTVTDSSGKTVKYRLITKTEAALPVVIIETENSAAIDSKDEYINAKMTVESDFSDGLPSQEEAEIKIKGRGNSTWYWSDKKPYKIKYQTDVSLLGLCTGKEWVLLANYNDKSLIRNYVALEAAKVLDNMECYATQYPVDVYLNGEYIGVYTLGEQIEESGDRVSLNSDATSVDTGFFMEIGGIADFDGPNTFSTRYMQCVEILEPSGSSLTDKHKTYIVNYIEMADDEVRRLKGYEDYIDIDSLIDWLILTEVTFNSDGAMRRSVFLKKDHGGKLEFGPVWDFDIAFGNSNTDFENYEAWCCLATEYGYVYENWICLLMKDEAFAEKLTIRWNEVKDELRASALEAADYGERVTAHSAEANFERWDILNIQVAIQPPWMTEYDTYEKQVCYLRDFINTRMDWIDGQLNTNE